MLWRCSGRFYLLSRAVPLQVPVAEAALQIPPIRCRGRWQPQMGQLNNGTYVYLKLVTSGGAYTAAALYWTRSAFSGGGASYSISGIAAGTYTGWVFIDMNGDAPNNSSALPDPGDYGLSAGQPITISGDQTQNVGVNGWQKD